MFTQIIWIFIFSKFRFTICELSSTISFRGFIILVWYYCIAFCVLISYEWLNATWYSVICILYIHFNVVICVWMKLLKCCIPRQLLYGLFWPYTAGLLVIWHVKKQRDFWHRFQTKLVHSLYGKVKLNQVHFTYIKQNTNVAVRN